MSRTVYVAVYFALLALLVATAWSATLELGGFNAVINLAIAAIKAGLIGIFFMHLRTESGLVRAAAVVGLAWVALLFVLSFADYLTR